MIIFFHILHLILCLTMVLFPAQWRIVCVATSTYAFMRDMCQRQSDLTYRLFGLLGIAVNIIIWFSDH